MHKKFLIVIDPSRGLSSQSYNVSGFRLSQGLYSISSSFSQWYNMDTIIAHLPPITLLTSLHVFSCCIRCISIFYSSNMLEYLFFKHAGRTANAFHSAVTLNNKDYKARCTCNYLIDVAHFSVDFHVCLMFLPILHALKTLHFVKPFCCSVNQLDLGFS